MKHLIKEITEKNRADAYRASGDTVGGTTYRTAYSCAVNSISSKVARQVLDSYHADYVYNQAHNGAFKILIKTSEKTLAQKAADIYGFFGLYLLKSKNE